MTVVTAAMTAVMTMTIRLMELSLLMSVVCSHSTTLLVHLVSHIPLQ
jgi:hypothetical protein